MCGASASADRPPRGVKELAQLVVTVAKLGQKRLCLLNVRGHLRLRKRGQAAHSATKALPGVLQPLAKISHLRVMEPQSRQELPPRLLDFFEAIPELVDQVHHLSLRHSFTLVRTGEGHSVHPEKRSSSSPFATCSEATGRQGRARSSSRHWCSRGAVHGASTREYSQPMRSRDQQTARGVIVEPPAR